MNLRHAQLVLILGIAIVPTAARAGDVDAERAVLELQRFYRSTTTCERVSIELRTPMTGPASGTKVTRSSMVVNLKVSEPKSESEPVDAPARQPGAPAGNAPAAETAGAPVALGLELRDLRIWVADRVLTAAHARDAATFAQELLVDTDAGHRWLSPRSLSRVLPPVLVPQLDFASAAPDTPTTELFPYASNVVWDRSEGDPRQPHRRTIHGSFHGGTVTLTTTLGRLRSVVIDRPNDRFNLQLEVSPVGACDPMKSAIDTTRRSRLPSIGDLRPRSGSLRTGVRSPDLALSRGIGAGVRWSMEDLLAPPVEAQLAGVPAAEHAVLVFIRHVPNPATGREAPADRASWRLDLARFGRLMAQLRRDAFLATGGGPANAEHSAMPVARFGMAPVLVMAPPTADELIQRLRDATELWGQDVLWTTDARGSIDLFAPGADVAAVVLDAEMVLRSVVVLDPKLSAEHAAEQVAAALFEVAPQQTPAVPPRP